MVNVGKSKVMRCLRYENGGKMHVRLNCQLLEEVDCFKYLGSQVVVYGGFEREVVHRMNQRYIAWAVMKSVLNNT